MGGEVKEPSFIRLIGVKPWKLKSTVLKAADAIGLKDDELWDNVPPAESVIRVLTTLDPAGNAIAKLSLELRAELDAAKKLFANLCGKPFMNKFPGVILFTVLVMLTTPKTAGNLLIDEDPETVMNWLTDIFGGDR